MDDFEAMALIKHCFEVACNTNPCIKRMTVIASTKVEDMELYDQPLRAVINPIRILNGDIPENRLIEMFLEAHERYIDMVYPVELHAPSNSIPQ